MALKCITNQEKFNLLPPIEGIEEYFHYIIRVKEPTTQSYDFSERISEIIEHPQPYLFTIEYKTAIFEFKKNYNPHYEIHYIMEEDLTFENMKYTIKFANSMCERARNFTKKYGELIDNFQFDAAEKLAKEEKEWYNNA
jgi:hypothetical protein